MKAKTILTGLTVAALLTGAAGIQASSTSDDTIKDHHEKCDPKKDPNCKKKKGEGGCGEGGCGEGSCSGH